MKNLIISGLLLFGILFAGCASQKTAQVSEKGTTQQDSKEVFVELSYEQHVKGLKLSAVQLSTIQMFASKAFQLTATGYSESTLVEDGTLVLQKVSLGTIIKFKDKIKGKVVRSDGATLMVQFHDGADGNIGPPIQFSAIGNGSYRIVTKNGVIPYSNVKYTPSDLDVVLVIKFKERTSSGQNSFSASGLEVNGSVQLQEPSDGTQMNEQQNEPVQQQSNPLLQPQKKIKIESVDPN